MWDNDVFLVVPLDSPLLSVGTGMNMIKSPIITSQEGFMEKTVQCWTRARKHGSTCPVISVINVSVRWILSPLTFELKLKCVNM